MTCETTFVFVLNATGRYALIIVYHKKEFAMNATQLGSNADALLLSILPGTRPSVRISQRHTRILPLPIDATRGTACPRAPLLPALVAKRRRARNIDCFIQIFVMIVRLPGGCLMMPPNTNAQSKVARVNTASLRVRTATKGLALNTAIPCT